MESWSHIIYCSDLLSYILEVGDSSMKILGDSKVSEKFQATIPRAVRDLLELDSGDRVVFLTEGRHVLVKKGRLEVQV
jgi:AbrB family looped-hinge helix DNA binding protein